MISKQDYPMTERLWARKKQTPLKVPLFHSRLFSANELTEFCWRFECSKFGLKMLTLRLSYSYKAHPAFTQVWSPQQKG